MAMKPVSKKELKRCVDMVEECNGNRQEAAQKLGINYETLRSRLNNLGYKKSVEEEHCELTECLDGKAVIDWTTKRVVKVEDAIQKAEIDLEIWEIERSTINSWEVGSKHPITAEVTVTPLWQIKVWLRRKAADKRAIETILKELQDHTFKLPVFKRSKISSRRPVRELEISIVDPHLGLQCFPPAADGSWNLEACRNACMETIEKLLNLAESFGPFQRILFPFGNDFLHSDNVFHTTTAGTGQPEAMSWHHVYLAGEKLAIEMIERLRKIAPVKVFAIPGNHDRQSTFTLGRVLKAFYHSVKDVHVNADASPYKFHKAGTCLIGWEHGHSISAIRLAALMANECPEDWATTTYREWHLGDQHRKGSAKPSMLEEQGVSIAYLPSLVPANEWHKLKGLNWHKRGAEAFIWDHKQGKEATFHVNI